MRAIKPTRFTCPTPRPKYHIRIKENILGPYTLAMIRAQILDGTLPETAEAHIVAPDNSDIAPSTDWRPITDLFDQMFPSWR